MHTPIKMLIALHTATSARLWNTHRSTGHITYWCAYICGGWTDLVDRSSIHDKIIKWPFCTHSHSRLPNCDLCWPHKLTSISDWLETKKKRNRDREIPVLFQLLSYYHPTGRGGWLHTDGTNKAAHTWSNAHNKYAIEQQSQLSFPLSLLSDSLFFAGLSKRITIETFTYFYAVFFPLFILLLHINIVGASSVASSIIMP